MTIGTLKDALLRRMCAAVGSITLEPPAIAIPDYGHSGEVTISWEARNVNAVEIRLGAPDGPLVARGDPTGTSPNYLVDGDTVFYLQNVDDDRPLHEKNTIARAKVTTWNARFCRGLTNWTEPKARLVHQGSRDSRKVLVAGWFSFDSGAATAGDLMARDVACEWLRNGGYSYDVALAKSLGEGVDYREVDPLKYSDVVFVCGPFGRNPLSLGFLERFQKCRKVGLNLSMTAPLDAWNPFDVLMERDSSVAARPELAFAARHRRLPVVGVIPVEPIPEYPERAMHGVANAAIRRLLAAREAAIVEIDTRLPNGLSGLRSASEVESLIARMDVVLTTRLHGMVLALKNGVPVVAIDPHAGGSKVLRQAQTIGWPVAFDPAAMGDQELMSAFDFCLTQEARTTARACAEAALIALTREQEYFLQHLERR